MKKTIFLTLLFFSLLSFAKDSLDLKILPVGEAQLELKHLAILPPFKEGRLNFQKEELLHSFIKIIRNDFSFYKKRFHLYDFKASDSKHVGTFYHPNFKFFKKHGSEYLVLVKGLDLGPNQNLKLIILLFDITKKKTIYKNNIFISKKTLRKYAHRVANDVYKKIIGKESIFNSQITFVSDRGSVRTNSIKDLYIMDFDGGGVKRLTRHYGTVISPVISPDKKSVVYSLIRETKGPKNIDLYLKDLESNKVTLLANYPGMNSGAMFLPDGQNIVLTISFKRNADIFLMNIKTKKLTRLTNHHRDDVDPCLSFDGNYLTFLSGRPGRPMIYIADLPGEENNVRRLSYVGRLHATPRFSPVGNEIVFASWVDNRFDLYRIDTSGNKMVRLTKNFGSNESPSFSNDGEFIVFSSQRVISETKAISNLYLMDRDGDILGALTKDFGNCTSPRWSR